MLNKFFKIIHNKYYKFFKFVFFLRYLFAVFLVSLIIFLTLPKFFNYDERVEPIKEYLFKNYNLEIKKYEKAYYQLFPKPSLEFKNVTINSKSKSVKFKVKNLQIFPKFFNIYNYENFQSNKIVIEKTNIILEPSDIKFLSKILFTKKKNFFINNLNLEIKDDNKSIIMLENIKFSNNKNNLTGRVFNKKFKINIKNNFKKINYKLLNSGVSGEIIFDTIQDPNFISGIFKSKILNTNLKFYFSYNFQTLNINNSYFRSKNVSFNNSSKITLKPFLNIDSKFNIIDINNDALKKIELVKLLKFKNIIKKFSSKSEINLNPKQFSQNLIKKANFKIDLIYGRLNYLKTFSIAGNSFKCKGDLNFLDDYPLIYYDCLVFVKNKKKLLKKLSISVKESNDAFDLHVKGSLGILNNKINFEKISTSNGYKASEDDLKFFKNSFEEIFYDKDFIEIFNFKKIKKFILEIS